MDPSNCSKTWRQASFCVLMTHWSVAESWQSWTTSSVRRSTPTRESTASESGLSWGGACERTRYFYLKVREMLGNIAFQKHTFHACSIKSLRSRLGDWLIFDWSGRCWADSLISGSRDSIWYIAVLKTAQWQHAGQAQLLAPRPVPHLGW